MKDKLIHSRGLFTNEATTALIAADLKVPNTKVVVTGSEGKEYTTSNGASGIVPPGTKHVHIVGVGNIRPLYDEAQRLMDRSRE